MEAMVRSGVLSGAPELVRELGGDADSVARQAGVSPSALRNPDRPIPPAWVLNYLETAASSCGCPDFGLRLSEYQSLAVFGRLWPLFESAGTVGELIRDIEAYFPLHTRGGQVLLSAERGGTVVGYDAAAGIAGSRLQVVELGFGILVAELRRHCPDWEPLEIQFRHAPPRDLNPYRQRLYCTPLFNSERNTIFLESELLRRPTRTGDTSLHERLAHDFGQLRRRITGMVCIQTEVVVRALLPFVPCDLGTIAGHLRLSRRTLQRRLKEQGTSFETIVSQVRADLAASYLQDSDLSITQIAEVLQYSETCAFSRSFKGHFGVSPRTYAKASSTARERNNEL